MTKKMLKALFASLVVITFVAGLAFADKGKIVTITEESILPDGQVLPPGKYKVVVDESAKEVQFWQNNKIVAKHTCKAVSLEEKVRRDELRYSQTPEKKQCLVQIRFAGRDEAYVLNAEHGM